MSATTDFVFSTLGPWSNAAEIKLFRQKFEESIIRYALKRTKGRLSTAARILDTNRNTLRERINKYCINTNEYKTE